MKLPRNWTALLAIMAVLVVAFTGMAPGRAKATLQLDPTVTGDNFGDPEDPGSSHRYWLNINLQTTPIDLVIRLSVAKQSSASSRTSKPKVHANGHGVSDRAR